MSNPAMAVSAFLVCALMGATVALGIVVPLMGLASPQTAVANLICVAVLVGVAVASFLTDRCR